MTTTHDQSMDAMDPKESPNTLSSGVRSVNNLPMYLIGGTVLIFLIVMMLVAADRANKQNRADEHANENIGDTNKFADKIAGNHNGGIIPAAAPTQPLTVPELSLAQPPTLARADNLNVPPMPPNQTGARQPRTDEEAQRIRQMKMQQLQEAIKAHTGVQIQAPRSAASPPGGVINPKEAAFGQTPSYPVATSTATDPTAVYKAKLAQLQNSGVIPGLAGQGEGDDSVPQLIKTGATSEANTIAQFGHTGHGDRWQLDSKIEAPRTPYELRAGFVVPPLRQNSCRLKF